MPVARPLWKRLLAAPFVLASALVLALEEWLWEPLKRGMAWLGARPVFRTFERWVRGLPAYPALGTFALPSAVLLPAKLLGVRLIAGGQAMWGLAVFLLAKVLATAFVGRLFALTEPALRTLPWFVRVLDRFLAFKRWVFAAVRNNPWVRGVSQVLHALRVRAAAALRAVRLRLWGP